MLEKLKIGDICNITTGKLDSNQFVLGGEYPFYTCAPEPLTIDSYAFDDSVILIAGNNAAGNFHVNRFNGKFNAYQRTYILTEKPNFDLDYIFYSLKLELKRLKEKAQGSQTKFLTMPILNDISIPKLDLKSQQKIAVVLSSLDSKIELNNKINAELEAMAKTLYDYWFVQFDFPDKDGKPYKTSGGKMVWNDELKREIPDGWAVEELKKHITIERGISYKGTDIQDVGIPMVNLNSFYLDGRYKYEGIKYFSGSVSDSKVIKTGDLMIATTDVTRNAYIIGKSFILPDLYEGKVVASCDIAKVCISDELNKYYLDMLFNSDDYHRYIKGFASGTLVLHLDTKGIEWYKAVIPPKYLLNKFADFKANIDAKKNVTLKENQTLSELRDWLLPMLMNGQVTVS
jgi:type I restriction enzyme S subunit